MAGRAAFSPVPHQMKAIEAFRNPRPLAMNTGQRQLLRTIASLPEFRTNSVPPERIAEYVLSTNEGEKYFNEGAAPLSFMLSGDVARLIGVDKTPLYYTITAQGSGAVKERVVRVSTDLARGMVKKSPVAEVFFDGGKCVASRQGEDFIASTCVFGDRDLFLNGDVVAKGGDRILVSGVDRSVLEQSVMEMVDAYIRAGIDLGTVGVSRMEGPDMCPIEVARVMERIDEIGIQASRDIGCELLPLTTSGSPEKGYFSHNDWRITSYGGLECLSALLEDKEAMGHFGIDTANRQTMLVRGYGEVGANIARLLNEVGRYGKYGFEIDGISDRHSAFFCRSGINAGLLRGIADEKDEVLSGGGPYFLRDSNLLANISAYSLADVDDLLYQPARILMPCGPGYSIPDAAHAARLKAGIYMPLENASLGTNASSRDDIRAIEKEMLSRKICCVSDWWVNFAGITGSKEEILHRTMAGGLDGLCDPSERKWLREHVLEGDVSDVAWANMFWLLHLWKKDGFKTPMSDIMEPRVDRILEERKRILLESPRVNGHLGNLMRMDSATTRAKVKVMAEDLADVIPLFEEMMRDVHTPEPKRRVAAYVLGKLCRTENIPSLLMIFENDNESDVMFRQSAVGLAYTLEGEFDSQGVAMNKVLRKAREIISGDPAHYSYSRKKWTEWLLSKLDMQI